MRVALVSLGCDKNTVDSERMLATLVEHGARQTDSVDDAEVILVNTCGFIDAAKEESIETILDAARLKREGRCSALVAVGCLVERYREELAASLPEVDLFIGLRDLGRLVPELQERGLLGDRVEAHPGVRLPLSSRRHVSYLKVSEGCDHGCAFCAIPLWRGRHRSFAVRELVIEAQRLEEQGTVELNLVAQDLAHYGRERRDGTDIVSLLEELLRETSIPWFRLLYIYSAGLRPALVELMASEDRILSYIDMPIQHAADPVLKRMRRPERRAALRDRIAWLRASLPDLTLRTTALVGFPGETEDDYRALLDFVEEIRFDRLGAFAFSPQDGTRAATMVDNFVPEPTGRERLEELLEIQRSISAEKLDGFVGRRSAAIVEGLDREEQVDPPAWVRASLPGTGVLQVGRLESQADDVDGLTWLWTGSPVVPGSLVEVQITSAGDYDLAAQVVALRSAPSAGGRGSPVAPGAVGGPRVRPLPLATLGLDSAWGR